jgi:ubiquinone/menaquinone biosynthesis C-methylase UbiE
VVEATAEVTEPKPHPGNPYFEPIGDTLGRAYLRYNFTKGSDQEVGFLLDLIGAGDGRRLLDVGCGPGRLAVPLARAGWSVTGIDISQRFLDIAAEEARAAGVAMSLFQVDARQMPFDEEFDVVMSICQGGFGLMGKDDDFILKRMMESARPGGRVVVSAFSAYFAAREQRDAHLDADAGVVHEVMTVKDPQGVEHSFDAWTSVYTPRELRLLALGVGLVPEHVWSVSPGAYARRKPDAETYEFLLVARKPA